MALSHLFKRYYDHDPATVMRLRSLRRCVFLALLLFVISTPVTFAQNTGKLTGIVTDARSGDALIGANVVLSGTPRGAATDLDGRFTLLGVSVGAYDVIISYIGYQDVTLEGVEINAGYTRDLEQITLTQGLEMEAVVVQYERPLLQKDAIGVPKIVTGKEIINLPIRGVNAVIAIQAGVVAVEGRDELNVRGGRSREIAYYIDGVKVISDNVTGIGSIGIPQAAIQEQEMLIGNISARYGDVMSGVVNITTKSGRSTFFGSFEALTSEGLDPYGTTLLSGSLGGPIVQNKLSFFVAGEFSNANDGNPRSVRQLRVDDEELARLEVNPQAISVTTEGGDRVWVAFPGDMELGARLPVDDSGAIIANEDGTVVASDGSVIQMPAGTTISSLSPRYAWEVVDPGVFSMEKGRRSNGTSGFSGTANLTFSPSESIRIRLGGRSAFARNERISQGRVLFAPGAFTELEDIQWQGFATWTHYVSDRTFYQLQVDFSDRRGWGRDPRFSRDVEDLLFYGDLDHPANAVAAQFKKLSLVSEERVTAGDTISVDVPTYMRQFKDGSIVALGLAVHPGGRNTDYTKYQNQQWRFSGSLTTQVGIHQLEIGAEYESLRRRRWSITVFSAMRLAGWFDDSDSCAIGACGAELTEDVDGDGEPDVVTGYADLPQQVFGNDYYGYDVRGLNGVEGQDILGYLDGTNRNVEPWKPLYYGGYLQDKIEFRDVVLNLGLRVDVFDNNSLVYRDPFARVPIVRAGTLANRPGSIEIDDAVYFDRDDVVGFRDLNGNFFNPNGEQVHSSEVVLVGNPIRSDLTEDVSVLRQEWEAVFEDYHPQVTVMPRIGASFPVTDQALFFGRFAVVSQRPSTFNYSSLGLLLDRSNTRIPNPDLKPEKTIEYEIGFRQRITNRIALTLSGFFRQIKDLQTLRMVENAFPLPYLTAQNVDFGTVKGFELNFDLRRTRNISLNANYTMSLAEGTGSVAATRQRDVLGREEPVKTIFPLNFDQRHRLNVSFDLRFGRDEGPVLGGFRPLENVGINVLVQAASGFPYTALAAETLSDFSGFGLAQPLGKFNAHRMPATSRIDVRIDRAFPLSAGASVSFFLWIQNLLDMLNIFDVYNTSGLADEDGFRVTPGGQQFLQSQLRPETADILYGHTIRDPEHYGIPRMVRLGARLTF